MVDYLKDPDFLIGGLVLGILFSIIGPRLNELVDNQTTRFIRKWTLYRISRQERFERKIFDEVKAMSRISATGNDLSLFFLLANRLSSRKHFHYQKLLIFISITILGLIYVEISSHALGVIVGLAIAIYASFLSLSSFNAVAYVTEVETTTYTVIEAIIQATQEKYGDDVPPVDWDTDEVGQMAAKIWRDRRSKPST